MGLTPSPGHLAEFLSKHDVGILLHDLCVVDVDSVERAAELEAQFPELRSAPMETTRQGRHYYFQRSHRADLDGYYDGPAQRERGVDFKTRCATGTSGFIVTSPSTDKVWVRPLWTTPLVPISDAVLDAVACSRQSLLPMRVETPLSVAFTSAAEVVRVDMSIYGTVVGAMRYFEPFLEQNNDDDNCQAGIRDITDDWRKAMVLLGDAQTFEELLFVGRYGVPRQFPDAEFCRKVIELADYLGAAPSLLRAFRPMGPVFRYMDVESAFPGVGREMHRTRLYQLHRREASSMIPAPPDWLGPLPVCHATMERFRQPTASVPLPALTDRRSDDRWLFRQLDHPAPKYLRASPALPPFVSQWLALAPGKIVLAGGGALHALVDGWYDGYGGRRTETGPHDYDFFLVNQTDAQAREILTGIARLPGVEFMVETENAVTFLVDDTFVAQVVLRIYADVEHVLLSFDAHPCKAAIYCDLPQQSAAIQSLIQRQVALPVWFQSIDLRINVVDPETWGAATLLRTFKYAHKGFAPFVPCVKRGHMHDMTQPELKLNRQGMGQLFEVEATLLNVSGLGSKSGVSVEALELEDVRHVLRHHADSDYSTLKRMTRSFVYAIKYVRSLVLCGMTANLRIFAKTGKELDVQSLVWSRPAYTDNILPRKQAWTSFYDLRAWMREELVRFVPWVTEPEYQYLLNKLLESA